MITFAGVSHVAFTVTDIDASQRFYTEVLDFVVVMERGQWLHLHAPQHRLRVTAAQA